MPLLPHSRLIIDTLTAFERGDLLEEADYLTQRSADVIPLRK